MIKRSKVAFSATSLILLISVALLAGCRSAKKSGKPVDAYSPLASQVQQLQAMAPIENSITAKMKIKADIAGKTISTGGTISIEEHAGIVLAIEAMGLFEVVRIETTPENMQIINKMGKEYTSLDYSEYGFLKQTGLGYPILESVLINKPFTPDGGDFVAALPRMDIVRSGSNIVVTTEKVNGMQYTFTFNATGELINTRGIYNDKVQVNCEYGDFTDVNQRSFPKTIQLSVVGAGKPLNLYLQLRNIKENSYLFRKSRLDDYRQMEIKSILDAL